MYKLTRDNNVGSFEIRGKNKNFVVKYTLACGETYFVSNPVIYLQRGGAMAIFQPYIHGVNLPLGRIICKYKCLMTAKNFPEKFPKSQGKC